MPVFYIVGTPIGNLGDISQRALEILRSVDFIAAEDTRVTLKLLNHFSISKPLVSYYQHNLRERGEFIVNRILGGESCALVTDAGMPAISDPGEDLVKLCVEANIEIAAVPGPSAAITALSLSGLDCRRFTFEGFLSTTKQSRKKHLESLLSERRTMVFYEAPHKLLSTLKDLSESFGATRKCAICREMTKLYEETIRTTLGGALKHFQETKPKGEFVLVIEGVTESENSPATMQEAIDLAKSFISDGKSISDAAKESAHITGLKKSDIYRSLLHN